MCSSLELHCFLFLFRYKNHDGYFPGPISNKHEGGESGKLSNISAYCRKISSTNSDKNEEKLYGCTVVIFMIHNHNYRTDELPDRLYVLANKP
jgi:hypothetical protein